MNIFRIGYLLVLFGVLVLVAMAAIGIAHFALFVIFPVIYGSGLSIIPFLLIFLGIVLMFFAPFQFSHSTDRIFIPPEYDDHENETAEEKKEERHYGGLIMIGPIPIVFGNDRNLIYISIAVAILIILVFILYYLR
ncbi:DUF131 domain-containing protein [Thermoplasma sp.]|uniref:TIGR00304 family membrane protein n=1 Tax=Thermoplasma sp. TaxID=1973142 RepID=UPI0012742959|nr:DUF131 domain-containing protein [Thermoplasma sp.]KAA8922083.1 MAG: DUF131 domain-containing protein [Thermoplasma sp.]